MSVTKSTSKLWHHYHVAYNQVQDYGAPLLGFLFPIFSFLHVLDANLPLDTCASLGLMVLHDYIVFSNFHLSFVNLHLIAFDTLTKL